jgi:hypothetical protein
MKNLPQELAELERLYRLNKGKLILAKILVIGLGVLSLCYAYYNLIMQAKRHYFHLVRIETIESMVLVGLFILPSLFLIPLYKFFTDRVENKINWDIKMSIFEDVLSKYSSDYKVSFKGILPYEDLKSLKLDNGITKFVYGDDLIFGTINSRNFRLSEIHSINFLGKSFHGLVAVIILNEGESFSNKTLYPLKSTSKIITTPNKIYLLKSNKKSLFEFTIKKDQVNKSSLLADHLFLADFMEELNALSINYSY